MRLAALVLVATISVLGLSACGTSRHEDAADSKPTPAAKSTPAAALGTISPLAPTLPAPDLPALGRPSELHVRSVAAAQATPIRVQAAAYAEELPSQHVTQGVADTLAFDPSYNPGGSISTLAYACFAFEPQGGTAPKNLFLGWFERPQDFADLYVLVADFSHDNWRILRPGYCGLLVLPEEGEYVSPLSGQSYVCVLLAGTQGAKLDLLQYGTELPEDSVFMFPINTVVMTPGHDEFCVYAHHCGQALAGVRNLQASYTLTASYEPDLIFAGCPGWSKLYPDGLWAGLPPGSAPDSVLVDIIKAPFSGPDDEIHDERRLLHVNMDSPAGLVPAPEGVLLSFNVNVTGHTDLGIEDRNFAVDLPNQCVTDGSGSLSAWSSTAQPELPSVRLLNPLPDLQVSPEKIYAGNEVTFDASATFSDPPATLSLCELDPGDGSSWQEMDAQHKLQYTYLTPGTYEAQYRVTNSYGINRTISTELIVLNPNANDRIYATPLKTSCAPGEHVRIVVYSDQAVYPFKYMAGARVTFASGNSYVPGSFNVGEPGGARWDVDGLWKEIDPAGFVEFGDEFIQQVDLGNGLAALDFNVSPFGGQQIDLATGALFSFELEVQHSTAIGFQDYNSVLRTMYSADDGYYRPWKNSTNAGQPGITVTPGGN